MLTVIVPDLLEGSPIDFSELNIYTEDSSGTYYNTEIEIQGEVEWIFYVDLPKFDQSDITYVPLVVVFQMVAKVLFDYFSPFFNIFAVSFIIRNMNVSLTAVGGEKLVVSVTDGDE